MINMLAVQCGHNVVQKMKQMFEDIENSKKFMKEFKESSYGQNQVEFECQILQSASWPSYAIEGLTIPK